METAPKIDALWCSANDGGMQLELSAEVNGVRHALATFVADQTSEGLFVDFYAAGQSIRMPVADLEKLIAAARSDVHSEAWYDKHLPRDDV